MNLPQPGILAPVPNLARYLFFSLRPNANYGSALQALADYADGEQVLVGIGSTLLSALEIDIPAMGEHPCYSEGNAVVPATPYALWVWIRTDDRGDHVHRTRAILSLVNSAFALDKVIDAFQHGESRDLTGYEDGTENPEAEEAEEAAIVSDQGTGLDGGSYVAVQQWVHDLDQFQSMPQQDRDHTIGRRLSDNEELSDAPDTAHVKRTAQEDFDPEAFVVRRSMPWADARLEGLVFVAFGKSFYAYDALLKRMVGGDDGLQDALFNFTKPITGSYFWCPPVKQGQGAGLDFAKVLKG